MRGRARDYNLHIDIDGWSCAMPQTLNHEDVIAKAGPLSQEELNAINRYWRAANYFSVGQIYLRDNALLREPLKLNTPNLGCWGILALRLGSTLFMRT